MNLTDKHLPFALQLYKGHTSSELNSFRNFINLNGENILAAQNKFEELYSSEIQNNGVSDNQPKDDYWNYEFIKVYEIFPSFYRQSTFIGLYSFFETRLYSLCDNLQRIKEYKLKLTDLNGNNYIEKSKKYLKLVVSLELNNEDLNILWTQIKDYQKIRNCLVHNNGYVIKADQQTFVEITRRIHYTELSSCRIQIIDDRFLLDFIETIEGYLLKLIDKIRKEIDFE